MPSVGGVIELASGYYFFMHLAMFRCVFKNVLELSTHQGIWFNYNIFATLLERVTKMIKK